LEAFEENKSERWLLNSRSFVCRVTIAMHDCIDGQQRTRKLWMCEGDDVTSAATKIEPEQVG
jgi:hypothetical protein